MLQELRPVGDYFADSVTDLRELKAFVCIFGGYGVDRLDRMLKEHTAALLNCIDTSLRSNCEVLELVAGSLHSGDRIEREASIKQIVDMDTVIGFCVQAGLALAFDRLLSEAAGPVLEEGAPLIHSLLCGIVEHIPEELPEKMEIRRMKGVANNVGMVSDHDSQWVKLILEEVGGANDGSWSLLPYLFSSFMTSNIWYTTAFNVDTGGFNNNIHCLARCVCNFFEVVSRYFALGMEFNNSFLGCIHTCPKPKSTPRYFFEFNLEVSLLDWNVNISRDRLFSNGHVGEAEYSDLQSHLSDEASMKSTMQLFVRFSARVILDSWSETNRHVALLPGASPRHSPAISLALGSPVVRQPCGDATPQYSGNDSGFFKGSSSHGPDHLYSIDTGSLRSVETRHWGVRHSGPLDCSSSQKVKFTEGSASGSSGPTPLPRFAVSRSGPLAYK